MKNFLPKKFLDSLTPEQRANILKIYDLADQEAEKFADRRDTLRVQDFVEKIRQEVKEV